MPQNNQKLIEARRAKVADFFLKGYSQQKIAEFLGISQPQVSRDLKAITKAWQHSAELSINKVKAQDLMKLRRLEVELNEGWSRSKYKIITEKNSQGEEEEKAIPLDGNPKFLEGVLRVIQRRADMLGYDVPRRLDHTSNGEKLTESKVIILPSNGREVLELSKGGADVAQNTNDDSV